jgi:hypothetical protein
MLFRTCIYFFFLFPSPQYIRLFSENSTSKNSPHEAAKGTLLQHELHYKEHPLNSLASHLQLKKEYNVTHFLRHKRRGMDILLNTGYIQHSSKYDNARKVCGEYS